MDVVIGGEKFTLELALNQMAIEKGLMDRESIPDHGGMLFAFPRSDLHDFWMGNCLVDLDIVFLDGTGRVTARHTMKVEPPRGQNETEFDYRKRMPIYSSRLPAQFAIELQAGRFERLGVGVGDRIELDLPRLKALVH